MTRRPFVGTVFTSVLNGNREVRMNTLQHSTRIAAVITLLPMLLLSPLGGNVQVVAAQGGIGIQSVTASSYGAFNGIKYLKHEGRFAGTTAGDYSVPFEIVAPADPTQGNGILVLEPWHLMGGTIAREAYLTPEFLFDRGFSHAAVNWHPDDVNPFEAYSIEDAVEILHNFALALRQDPEAQALVGDVQQLYAVSVSKACEPLHGLLHSPGASLLDFTLLIVPTWAPDTHEQPPDSNPVMVFLTEAELVRAEILSVHTGVLRGSSPTYRSYEVAGAPHIPDVPWTRNIGIQMFDISSEGTTPLDWTPVLRALFLAGHRWATEGAEPPPSMALAQGAAGQTDSVYEARYGLRLETGIARDEKGNALGGIRLPDLQIGRGQFIAVDPASFLGMGVYGAFEDLQCEPLSDGSPQFADHGAYVSQFTQQAERLVAERLLLPEDAERMIAKAAGSDVGKPEACAPAALPVTGIERRRGEYTQLLALAGLILVSALLGLRHWASASR
jgi:hypothetical protein